MWDVVGCGGTSWDAGAAPGCRQGELRIRHRGPATCTGTRVALGDRGCHRPCHRSPLSPLRWQPRGAQRVSRWGLGLLGGAGGTSASCSACRRGGSGEIPRCLPHPHHPPPPASVGVDTVEGPSGWGRGGRRGTGTGPVGWFDSKPSLLRFPHVRLFPGGIGAGLETPEHLPPGEFAAPELSAGQVGSTGALPTGFAKPQSRKAPSVRYKGLYLIICFIISRLEPG